MSWQVQQVKQHLSEVLRAVAEQGPQTITKHGDEIAVVIDIEEYRRLITARRPDPLLAEEPVLDEQTYAATFGEVERRRARDMPRAVDFGAVDEGA